MQSKQRRKKKKSSRIFAILIAICLCVMAVSLYKLISISLEYRTGEKEYDRLKQYAMETSAESVDNAGSFDLGNESETENSDSKDEEKTGSGAPVTVDFTELKKINPDIIGWLYIKALDLSYPVVQGTDNEQYLHHTFEGTENFAGTLFADAEIEHPFQDCNTIIYGHNMKDQSMFGKLKLLLNEELYKNDSTFWILTPEEDYCYRIFNLQYTDTASDIYTIFSGPGEDFLSYINSILASSVIPQEQIPEFDENTRIVTLSTCAAAEGSGRFVCQGVRIAAD